MFDNLGLDTREHDAEEIDVLLRIRNQGYIERIINTEGPGAMWGKIIWMPIGGTFRGYPATAAGRAAAFAQAIADGLPGGFWVPPCTIAGDFTVPDYTVFFSIGNRATMNGKCTLGEGAHIKGITVSNVTSSGSKVVALATTATTAINTINDCGVNAENTGAGGASGVEANGAGHELRVWGSSVQGLATGGGSGYGVEQVAGDVYVSDDGKIHGSTGKFSGTVELFSFDDVIIVKTSTFPQLYNATAAGLTAALAAASSGDLVLLPRGTISSSVSFAIPAGVTVKGAGSTTSSTIQSVGDVGQALVDMTADGCGLDRVNVNYDTANSASERNGIRQTGDESGVRLCHANCANAGSGAGYGHVAGDTTPGTYANVSFSSSRCVGTKGAGEHAGYLFISGGRARECYGGDLGSTPIGIKARSAQLRQCQGEGSQYGVVAYSTGVAEITHIIGGDAEGGTTDFVINDATTTAQLYAFQYDTITNNGAITWLRGDRSAYSVEDWHASDIEADVMTRHLPAPTGDPLDDGKVAVLDNGATEWVIGEAVTGDFVIAVDDVSNPPTEAQLITAFGAPDAFANDNKIGLLNDAGAGLNEYAVFSDGGHYWMAVLAKAAVASLSVAVSSTTTIAEDTGQWFGRASLERLSDGTWVLCYREGDEHGENSTGVLHIKFSDDDAATWTAEDTDLDGNAVSGFPMDVPSSPNSGPGEPWLYLAPNGTLILHMWNAKYDGVGANILAGTYQSTSTDSGKTWSTPAQINFTGITDDNRTFATDDHFVLGSVIYAGARIHQDDDFDPGQIVFIKSTDNGGTWEYVSDISSFTDNNNEVGLEYVGNNRIVAILRDTNSTTTYKSVSTDLGATWSALEDITSTFEAAGRVRIQTRAHLKGYSNWWTDSVLIANGFEFTTPGSSHPRRNAIWISQDRGETWDGPYYVAAQTTDAGYGDMLYDALTDKYVFISYQGDNAEADLVQYKLTITGI